DPDFVECHFNLGIVLAKSGRFAEAIEQFRSAADLRPAYADAYYNLGLALMELRRDGEAVEQFRETLRRDPNYLAAEPYLAKTYARLNRPAEAIATAKEALASARASGQTELAAKIEDWLTKYQAELKKGDATAVRP